MYDESTCFPSDFNSPAKAPFLTPQVVAETNRRKTSRYITKEMMN